MSESTTFDEALTLHQCGQIAEAEDLYRRVLEKQPDHTGALHLLGVALQQQGDYEAALALIGRAIAVNPNKAIYHNNQGAAFQSLGRFEEAAACFQRALGICPNYADAFANRGMAEASLGEDSAAAASYRAALAIEPGHADATRHLASFVQHLGPGEKANCLYRENLPHCSAASLAVPLSRLGVFGRQFDTLSQSAANGRAAFHGQIEAVYDGRNPHFVPIPEEAGAGDKECIDLAPREQNQRTERYEYDRRHADHNVPEANGTAPPWVSVIMPVHNGEATIERAIRSLQTQAFSHWEAVMVDDASCDTTWEVLQRAAASDGRIRTVRLAENRGPSAARNEGLRRARGEFIAYLDADDEYYPGYLEQVAAERDKGDVLMFGFDVVYEQGMRECAKEWDPRHVRRILFSFNPLVPLAVAHRRSLFETVGGFHELISQQEDWDLWKRMARAGTKFAYLSGKSGVYHVRPGSLSRVHRLTVRQREAIMANWAAGRPIFSLPNSVAADRKPSRKIAYVSPHCVTDFTSHAASATLHGLQLLAGSGFECQVFCGTRANDDGNDIAVEEVLSQRSSPYTARKVLIGPFAARMIFSMHGEMPITLFQTASSRGTWRDEEEVAAFLIACELFLRAQRPDAVWTFGDDPVSLEVLRLLKRLDIPIILALHERTHRNPAMLTLIDYAVVPSELARQHYWETLGLACQLLPPAADFRSAASKYHEFFSDVRHQPGPPLVPKGFATQ